MAFTEATLQAQLDAEGLNCKITRYEVIYSTFPTVSHNDVYVENANSTKRKSAWASQIAQTNSAAQAATAVLAALNA